MVAEGTANARTVGRFRGTVHALVLGRRGLRRTPEARYLVSDPGMRDPFWVSQDEVSNIVPPDPGAAVRRHRPATGSGACAGYVSVPASEELQGAEFDAQLEAIDRYCDEHGWELVEVVRDVDTRRAGTWSGRGCSMRSTRSGAARPRASSSPSSGG